ncbi:putative sensor histidine kinase pdtaS [Methanosarcinales archaeon]|nr:putative sensor histidine kinase pdtaS [Methanosarcinales archaeon]
MKHALKLLAIIVSVFLIGFFLEETIDSSELNNIGSLEETLEIISELFSVFVAISIFGITWYAYNKSRDNHSLLLGAAFLITGILILFHLLSYPFMPDFINPNSSHKAGLFFLESRFILAILLLASVYVYDDSLPELINKNVMVLFIIVILSVFMGSVFIHEAIFAAYKLDSYSAITVLLLFVITIIISVACYLYAKRAKETGQKNLLNLTNGSIIILFSNLVYFDYEFSGHFLIITGFFYFYLGLYKSSVELPYEKLAIAEEKLRVGAENKYRNLFDNANDAIITTDLEDRVTSWNHSAEKLFGWEAQEVMGKKLSSQIVPLNLQTQREEIINNAMNGKLAYGIETARICKDGTRIFVDLTTSQLLDPNRNLTGLSFILHDITERKLNEETIKVGFRRLEEEKAKTESIIAALGDAISIQDTDFKVLYQNKIHQDIVGDQKGKYCYREYEHRDHICEGCPVNMTFTDGKIHIEERSMIKDRQKLFYEITSSPLRDSTDNIIAGIEVARDITKRKQTEEALNKSRNLLDTIKSVQDNFIVDSDIKVTFNDILSNVLSLTQSEYGFIGEILYTAKGDPFLKIHAFTNIAWNKEIQEFYEKNAPQGIEFYDLKTLFGSVITGGKPVIANDPSTDARRGGLPEGHPQLYKFLGIPFYHGGKLNGMIGVANRPEGYNEDIIEYLKPLLTTCANIIEAYRIDQRRKLAEKQIEVSLTEKETLLKEIHHRVKNNMQIVSSLLDHQKQYIKDKNVIGIFTESQNRIASMSLVHEKLYQSKDLAKIEFNEYINDLAANLFQSYAANSGNIKLNMNIENIQMDIDFAIPCGLIINELVTNSLKYAFPEDRKGEIRIVLRKTDKEMFELVIGDNGIGLPKDMDFKKTDSLGLHLVTILAENQLHGEINLIRNMGTEFQIKFRGIK